MIVIVVVGWCVIVRRNIGGSGMLGLVDVVLCGPSVGCVYCVLLCVLNSGVFQILFCLFHFVRVLWNNSPVVEERPSGVDLVWPRRVVARDHANCQQRQESS